MLLWNSRMSVEKCDEYLVKHGSVAGASTKPQIPKATASEYGDNLLPEVGIGEVETMLVEIVEPFFAMEIWFCTLGFSLENASNF